MTASRSLGLATLVVRDYDEAIAFFVDEGTPASFAMRARMLAIDSPG